MKKCTTSIIFFRTHIVRLATRFDDCGPRIIVPNIGTIIDIINLKGYEIVIRYAVHKVVPS